MVDNAFLKKRQELEVKVDGWEKLIETDQINIVDVQERSITVEMTVNTHHLNLRGYAHGGFLFSLCDMGSGLLVYSQGLNCVTLNSSVNYLRGAKPGDVLTIHADSVHWGKKTIVNEILITNQDGTPCVRATVTMFVLGELCLESETGYYQEQ